MKHALEKIAIHIASEIDTHWNEVSQAGYCRRFEASDMSNCALRWFATKSIAFNDGVGGGVHE